MIYVKCTKLAKFIFNKKNHLKNFDSSIIFF